MNPEPFTTPSLANANPVPSNINPPPAAKYGLLTTISLNPWVNIPLKFHLKTPLFFKINRLRCLSHSASQFVVFSKKLDFQCFFHVDCEIWFAIFFLLLVRLIVCFSPTSSPLPVATFSISFLY